MPRKKSGLGSGKDARPTRKVVPFRKRRDYKKLFTFFLLLAIIAAVALFTPIFNIKSIDVVGNQKFTKDEIISMSGIPIGQNIFKINYFKVKDDILSNSYIEKVKISRLYPNRVRLKIEERKPVAYFEYMNSYLTIDKNGRVLDLVNSLEGVEIPTIMGIRFKDYKLGDFLNINEEDKPKFDILKECLNESIVNNLANLINKIDLSDINKVTMWAYKDKYEIKLVDGQKIPYKFKMLEALLVDLEKNKSPRGVIDFTIANKVTFKPKWLSNPI